MEKLSPLARFAKRAADETSRPVAFVLAALAVVIWAASGSYFGYNENWFLILNTGTAILTFLMVFLVHTARHRDTQAMQIKLDEIIRATEGARNNFMALEVQHEDKNLTARRELEHEAAQAPAEASRSG